MDTARARREIENVEARVQHMDELALAQEHGAVGVFMRGVEGDRLHDAYFYAIYDEVSRRNMAIGVHIGNSNTDMATCSADADRPRLMILRGSQRFCGWLPFSPRKGGRGMPLDAGETADAFRRHG
jgi:hypothetical protein